MRKLGIYIWLIIILLCSGTVYAANVTVSIDNSSSTYISSGASSDVNVNLSGWEIWVRDTDITKSISGDDITKNDTDANGNASFDLTDGSYFVGAVYFDKGGALYVPLYMGIYNQSNGDLILQVPGNDTINISDFSKAGAVRGYVKDTSDNGIKDAKVTVVNWPDTIPSAYSIYLDGYSIKTNDSGYYSIFLPVETTETTFTLKVSVSGYTPQTFDVNVTQGMGAADDFVNNTNLSEEPKGCTNCGRGGGGGGGGTPTSFETYIKNLLKGQAFELDIDDEDIPYINGLSLTAKQDIYSSKLSITDYDKKPWSSMKEPDAGVSRYFRVSYTKNNDVESAKLRFSANKSWLKANDIDPNSVLLYHYTTSWGELDSEILKEDDENIYFEATTSKFSYFSIGGEVDSGYKSLVEEEEVSPTPEEEEKPVEPPEVETPTPAPPVETPEPAEQEPVKAPEASEGEEGGICGPTTILLISVLSLLAIRGRYRR